MDDINYILYARKSTESEDKQVQSIEDQVDVMLDLAARQGLKVIAVMRESRSAKAPFRRLEFDKMLATIKSGKANGILSWQLNRLSRNPAENGILQQMLQDEKIMAIQTYDRAYLPDDNAVVFGVEASMANQFIRDLRKGVKRGIAAKLRSGGISGVAPAGYTNNRLEKTIEIDPLRFPLIRKSIDMFLTGAYSVPQVLDTLNNEWLYRTPVRTKSGGQPLSRTGLYDILGNPRLAGLIPNPEQPGEYFEANFPAMITMAEFDKVQELLGNRGKPRLCAGKQFMLKGLLQCGECNCAITAELKSKKLASGQLKEYTYYHCTRKRPCSQKGAVTERDLLDKVTSLIDDYELTEELHSWGVEALQQMADSETAESIGIRKMQVSSAAGVQAQLDTLLDLATKGFIEPEDYKAKSTTLKLELIAHNKQHEITTQNTKNWHQLLLKQLDTMTDANTRFAKGGLGDKANILLAIGQNPTILAKELKITPYAWLLPIKRVVQPLREQLSMVRNEPQQIEKASEEACLKVWYPRTDSNRHQLLRTELFYPLNYRDTRKDTKTTIARSLRTIQGTRICRSRRALRGRRSCRLRPDRSLWSQRRGSGCGQRQWRDRHGLSLALLVVGLLRPRASEQLRRIRSLPRP